jgi:alpha-galactosidase
MKTVIVDDGWQTGDNNRGYAFCGDWEVCKEKIPDMAELVRQVHDLGMRFVLWYAVPLIGKNSKAFRRFRGRYLYETDGLDCSVLDPRYPDCRAYLRDFYLTAAKAWDLDGLKLDFIDSFRLTETSNTDTTGMDCVNLEEAVQRLLAEVTDALRAFKSDFLIEFRQSYVGPVMRRFGNMLRVGDCPYSALHNRSGSVTLRLLSGGTAVHSDMLEWNSADSAENAALQLASILFCVPQISVRMETLPREHRDTLRFYLDFWKAHRDVLMQGKLTAEEPEHFWSRVTAQKDGEGVTAVYGGQSAALRGCEKWSLVNASGSDTLLVEADRAFACEVSDCTGARVGAMTLPAGLSRLPIPVGGIASLREA